MGREKVKNNRGFTVVELVVSFTLTLVVILLLFQIVISLKDLYVKDGVKTELLIKQSLMSQKITTSLNDQKVVVAAKCTGEANCLSFTFDDGSVKTLSYNKTTNIFHYGDYTTKLVAGSKFGNIDIVNETFLNIAENRNDSLIKIKIPISHNLVKGDYGISIDYLYDSRKVAVGDLNLGEAATTEQIFLKGNSNLVLQDTSYTEPGYYVRKTDGTIIDSDSRVVKTGSVGTGSGVYKLTYTLTVDDTVVSTKVRTVSIVKTINNFDFTNDVQTFNVPIKGNYKVELWGAQGGGSNPGGKGAYTSGIITLDPTKTLYVYVGQGLITTNDVISFNGGTGNSGGYPGGGATDVRLQAGTWYDFNTLKSRVMVAAGGGSGYGNNTINLGYGGTLTGGAGGGTAGGTQTVAGAKQNSGYSDSGFGYANGGCSGGGGYYGGGAATCSSGAGGGSSFISGHTGCNAISESSASNSSIVHTNQPNHYSGMTFTSTTMTPGNASMPNPRGSGNITGNGGNGYAKITLVSVVS